MTPTNNIALSIRPKYAAQIFDGTKRFEFRRTRPRHTPDKMYIHVCREDANAVQGVVIVTDILSGTPAEIWQQCKHAAGITIDEFYEYFNGCCHAHAYVLESAKRLSEPIDLKDLCLKKIPQSFCYVKVA